MKKILGIAGILVACIGLRLIPHAPNLVPMTALAVFFGYTIRSKWGVLLAPLAVILTDFSLGFYEWQVMIAVYGSYTLIALLSMSIRAGKNPVRMVLSTGAGSLIFFVLTNGAVWAFSAWYAKSPAGLLSAYMNGLPFLRNSFLADLGYGALFYAGYALYRARAPLVARLRIVLARNKKIIATR
jgi:hypothetical protein